MKKVFFIYLATTIAGSVLRLSSQESRAESLQPPQGSWESWMLTLQEGREAPLRPDGREMGEALPIWVDCQLSWIADHPQRSRKLRLPKGITLRVSKGPCQKSLLNWAQ